MAEKEEKENPYVLEVKMYDDREKLSYYNRDYFIKTKDHDIKFEVNARTSSCGSVQIMNMFIGKYQVAIDSGLNLEQRKEILEKIKETYDQNHMFFIDQANGALEKFFSDLGFIKCWTYFNGNSENVVNLWSLNRQTEDEFYAEQEEEQIEQEEWDW